MKRFLKWSPLMIACYDNDVAAVDQILRTTSVDVNAREKVMHWGGDEAYTPLMMASYLGRLAIVARLLQVPGIDLNARSSDQKETALDLARVDNSVEVEKLLRAAMGLPAREQPDIDDGAFSLWLDEALAQLGPPPSQ